jgi:hypothetical protein
MDCTSCCELALLVLRLNALLTTTLQSNKITQRKQASSCVEDVCMIAWWSAGNVLHLLLPAPPWLHFW